MKVIKKEELNAMIQAEMEKQEKKLQLEGRIKELEAELSIINENVQSVGQPNNSANTGSAEKTESIFDARPGETIVFNFQDVTIKVQRQLDDLFKIVDASESKKLKDGDYIKIQGNDTLQVGKRFKFVILREALKYESNPIASWKVIKNR